LGQILHLILEILKLPPGSVHIELMNQYVRILSHVPSPATQKNEGGGRSAHTVGNSSNLGHLAQGTDTVHGAQTRVEIATVAPNPDANLWTSIDTQVEVLMTQLKGQLFQFHI
jgi:hypothetical protein